MTLLGQEFNESEQLLSLCEILVCKMYGKPAIMDVNEMSFAMRSSGQLPLSRLLCHLLEMLFTRTSNVQIIKQR